MQYLHHLIYIIITICIWFNVILIITFIGTYIYRTILNTIGIIHICRRQRNNIPFIV